VDFEQTPGPNGFSANPPAEPSTVPTQPSAPASSMQSSRSPAATDTADPRRRSGSGWRILLVLLLVFSLLANVLLFCGLLLVAGLATTGGAFLGAEHEVIEHVLQPGPASTKIAVIRLDGMIENNAAELLRRQFRVAERDDDVVAVILLAQTPGGTVSASDRIHHAIREFRRRSGKPIVAFMQSVAASGGYYVSVACDKIVAEPTAITGSIGVLLNTMVLQELLEEKLGIQPVVIKSGPRKDWPSMFSEVTPEQKQYLTDKLIMPAYDRFVDIVAQGRFGHLTPEAVRTLADGSIYGAEEAVANGLIDSVGYMDKAIATACSLAGISEARVVEYARPLSILSMLTAESRRPAGLDAESLQQWLLPQRLYLWDGTR